MMSSYKGEWGNNFPLYQSFRAQIGSEAASYSKKGLDDFIEKLKTKITLNFQLKIKVLKKLGKMCLILGLVIFLKYSFFVMLACHVFETSAIHCHLWTIPE